MIERVLAVVLLDVADTVLDEDRPEVPQPRAARAVKDTDVRQRATEHEVPDPAGVQPPLELRLLEGVVGVFLDDVVRVLDGQFLDDFGLPGPLEDVFAPLVELVVVVGVLELLGWMDVPRVDDRRTTLVGPLDEVRDRPDGLLAAGRVQ